MSKISQYRTLAMEGCLIAFFLGSALHGRMHVAIEIQRNIFKLIEENRPWPLIIFSYLFLIFWDEVTLRLVPYNLGFVGIRSTKATLIFPVVNLVAFIVAWYTGYLPVIECIVTPVHDLLHSYLLIIKEGERSSTPYPRPPSVATRPGQSQPGSQIPHSYSYQRLVQQRSIRILTLEPSRLFEEPLKCRLFEVLLDDSPRYTALSYAWDVAEGDTSIFCNGKLLKVTRNCARALHRIRQMQGSNSINLWVDAICIDQGTTPETLFERTQQIQIMGEVYKNASHVTAWVGEHVQDSRYICEFLESVGRVFDSGLDDASSWRKAESSAMGKAYQWPRFDKSLREFFQRSFFTRMWPIQEVTLPLPGRVSLLCGDSSIRFEYIRACWQILAKMGWLTDSGSLDQSVALQFYLADALALKRNSSLTIGVRQLGRPLITDLSQLSLTSIMRCTRFKACSQAKDKFFALLGVFQELELPHKVDASRYAEITEEEVFLAVFESCVAFDKSLDVLRLAQSPEGYVGHDSFWAQLHTPYNSFANALLGTFAKISPRLLHGFVENAPKTRASLPSWLPDWTQWTHGDIDDRDIAFIRSYSTRAFSDRPLWNGTSSTKLDSPICNHLHSMTTPADRVLANARAEKSKAREVIFAQGFSHVNIREAMTDYLSSKDPQKSIDPEEVIAYVAAAQTAILFGDTPSILYWRLPAVDGGRESQVSQRIRCPPRIRVEAKVVGVVRSVGSVDSTDLLWQLITTIFNFYYYESQWIAYRNGSKQSPSIGPFFQPVVDAFVAAMIETLRNFVARAHLAQIVHSLRMAYQAFGVTAFFRYLIAAYQTWYLQPVLKRVFCSICPSAAECLGSDLEFGEHSWITIGILTVLYMIEPGDDPSSSPAPVYHRFRHQISTLIICGTWMIWHFRVSFYITVTSHPYENHPPWFMEPCFITVIAFGALVAAIKFKDDVLILLARATLSIGTLLSAVGFLFLSPLQSLAIVMLTTTGFLTCRCIRGTVAEIWGSEMFARRASFTSGLNFFTTESGLTGSTSGPVQLCDVVIIVDRASDPMVMRRCEGEFKVVGAAYVGNKSKKELEESSVAMEPIWIL
jgi:hypothetical protein